MKESAVARNKRLIRERVQRQYGAAVIQQKQHELCEKCTSWGAGICALDLLPMTSHGEACSYFGASRAGLLGAVGGGRGQ